MHNQFLSIIASALVFIAPPSSPSLVIPRMAPNETHVEREMFFGKPEEQLRYLLDTCASIEDVIRLARSFDAVAKLYDEQDEHDGAEKCYMVAIRLMKLYLPKNSPELATEYCRLSAHYSQLGQGELARATNLQALQIFKSNGQEYNIELAVTEHNQAWLELYVGRKKAAEMYLKDCLKLLKTVLGADHLLIGLMSSSLGEVYMFDGNFHGAEKLFKTALGILPQYTGTEEVTKYVNSNYAMVVDRLGRKSEKVVHGRIK